MHDESVLEIFWTAEPVVSNTVCTLKHSLSPAGIAQCLSVDLRTRRL